MYRLDVGQGTFGKILIIFSGPGRKGAGPFGFPARSTKRNDFVVMRNRMNEIARMLGAYSRTSYAFDRGGTDEEIMEVAGDLRIL